MTSFRFGEIVGLTLVLLKGIDNYLFRSYSKIHDA